MSVALISDIADDLEMGLRCFVHKKDRTKISVPTDDQLDHLDEEDEWQKEIEHLKKNKKNYTEVETLASHESFIVMERFADEVPDIDVQYRLTKALQQMKPFQHFKLVVEQDAHYRQEWFKFKRQALMEWVERQLRAGGLI